MPTPEDPRDFYLNWIAEAEATDVGGFGHDLPFCEFEMTYWRERHRPNLLMAHYNDLKVDLAGEMRRISDFLEIDTPASLLPELAKAAEFETMKAQGAGLMPALDFVFEGGSDRFLNKGTNGRWKGVLTENDLARFDAVMRERLSLDAAAWLTGGRLAAGDPTTLAD